MRTHLSLLLASAVMQLACSSRDQPLVFAAPASSNAPGIVKVNEPDKLWSIETGKVDPLGRPVRVACVTCHTLRQPEALPERPEDLKEFHKGLHFDHGSNRCASCHVIGAQDSLRLADGRRIDMKDAILLCGQCHGPQLRDWKAGAHGGMQGQWDLQATPTPASDAGIARLRNHCVDCHDPHVPKFAPSTPVLPPRDRRLGPPVPHEEGVAIPRLSPAGGHP